MLFLREWYMHPNGQLPGLRVRLRRREPAGARLGRWRVYKMTGAARPARPRLPGARLSEAAAQLHLVGEPQGRRGQATSSPAASSASTTSASSTARKPLPDRRPPRAGRRHGVDGVLLRAPCSRWRSSWRSDDPAYEDMASKFFEHFVAIADAMNTLGGTGLWDEEDGFYYDQLHVDGAAVPLRVRSLVGLIPLFAVEVLEDDVDRPAARVRKRMRLVPREPRGPARATSPTSSRPRDGQRASACSRSRRASGSSACCATCSTRTSSSRRTASARSRASTRTSPTCSHVDGEEHRVDYVPGESTTRPVRRQLELARARSGSRSTTCSSRRSSATTTSTATRCRSSARPARADCMNLDAGRARARRAAGAALPARRRRPPARATATIRATPSDPHWRDLVLFHEYFHGDTGRGLGASHQTGWTALAIRCLEDLARGVAR